MLGVPERQIKKKYFKKDNDPLTHSRILVFDTETTTDKYQNLKLGYFKIFHKGLLQHHGLFYDNLTEKEYRILLKYSQDLKIPLYTKDKFIELFYQETYFLKTLCVGFNLPFDLSRLCINFGCARYSQKGGFSFQLSDDKFLPRIRIKQLNGDNYNINFSRSKYNKGNDSFNGYFLEVQRLASIFTDKKRISLKQACEIFNTKTQKLETNEHGKVTKNYIKYLIHDVQATYELYLKIKEEFEKYQIEMPLTKIYSSASMGKQALRQLGINPFTKQNQDFPSELMGNIMSAYFGGRTECKIRKTPIKVSTLDFTSMYPTMTILMGLWECIIADKIDYIEDTENVQALLNKITCKDLTKKELWKSLNVLVELQPNEDILPIRSNYNEYSDIYNVGLNYLKYKENLFYALPDVIASKILSERTPKIKKAIRFIPLGKQKTLKQSKILEFTIDSTKENFIMKLVEERQRIKKYSESLVKENSKKSYLLSLQKALKILVNSTTYGIFVEMNSDKRIGKQEIFSNTNFNCSDKRIEKLGDYFNPIIAVMLTSGSRLLLAMAEKFLISKGYNHAYMDTDSIYTDPKIADELSKYFDSLNPYSFKESLLKIEKINKLLYAISSKRYCLYTLKNGNPIISSYSDENEYKLHGLGHLLNPFSTKNESWHKEIWEDILKLHYGIITEQDIYEKYLKFCAISKLTISTPTIMKKFEILNKNKSINKKIKPFNFVLIGIGNKKKRDVIKPIAPFTKDNQKIIFESFIDYKTGKKCQGIEYWQPLSEIILNYINHKESKSDGDIGTLKRKHLRPQKILYIGKETRNIDKQVLDKSDIQEYHNLRKILDITPEQARKLGIKHRSTLKRIKDKIKQGKKVNLNSSAVIKLLRGS